MKEKWREGEREGRKGENRERREERKGEKAGREGGNREKMERIR